MSTMMPYVALALRTTGPNPARHQLLQLVMVLDDNPAVHVLELPKFVGYVNHEEVNGSPEVLAECAPILQLIASEAAEHRSWAERTALGDKLHPTSGVLFEDAAEWLEQLHAADPNHQITIAHHRPIAPELRFIAGSLANRFHQWVLDPRSMAMGYGVPSIWEQGHLPSLQHLDDLAATEDARDEACTVVRAIRNCRPRP